MDETITKAPKFDWGMSESYNLSIQLSLDGLSFCILDPVTNSFLYLCDVSFDKTCKQFAEQEKYIICSKVFSLSYRKVFISIESPVFNLMPLSLYDDERIKEVMALVGINVRDNDRILRNNIELSGSTTVFTIPNFLYFFLRSQFPNAVILHTTTPVISSMLFKTFGNNIAQVINLSFETDGMTLVATDNNELKLCNRYYCKEPLDYVYMLLYVIKQLGFIQDKTYVMMSGNISIDDIRVKAIKRFSNTAMIVSPPRYFEYAFRMPENPQKHFSLFLMPLCV